MTKDMTKERICIDGIFDIDWYNKKNELMEDQEMLTTISEDSEVFDWRDEAENFRNKEKKKGLIVYAIDDYDYLSYSFQPKFKTFVNFFCKERDIDGHFT